MEKKRGSRPTWAQVKELEGIIADLKGKNDTLLKYQSDGHDAIVEESATMSKELTELRKKLGEQIDGTSKLVADCDAWREKYKELKERCLELEKQNGSLNDECNQFHKANSELRSTIKALKLRGFWARAFNR